MGTTPVKELVIQMALPMMISMLIQSLYNIIDSMFVAQVSEQALTAVSLAFPIQNLMVALQVGTGVGVSAALSRSLGEGDDNNANTTANNSVLLGFFHYGLFLLFGLFLVRPFFASQTSDPLILKEGITYLSIIASLSIGQFMQVTYERLMQSTGKTFYTMITQGMGAIINLILDPILIFGLLGFPKMGVAGAALATVIGQVAAAVLAFILNTKKNQELQMEYKTFRPDWKNIRDIYSVGVPATLMVAISSVTMFLMNLILMTFSATAAAVFGVYFQLQSFVFMPVFGLTNGMIPILSYNYGAKNKQRLIETIKICMIYATVMMMAGLVMFQLFPGALLGFFNASEDMLFFGIPALRIISLTFVFAGFSIISSSVYQAFGEGILSFGESFIRQIFVLIPVAYVFSLSGNVNTIWWAYPIAETVSGIYCGWFLYKMWLHVIKPLPELDEYPSRLERNKPAQDLLGK